MSLTRSFAVDGNQVDSRQLWIGDCGLRLPLVERIAELAPSHHRTIAPRIADSFAVTFRSEKRPSTVHVSAAESENEWTFSVADNGIGMAEENLERTFQLFQRLNAALEFAGTGIGLATCKKVVAHHGGRIWVESKPDVGSTICLHCLKWGGGRNR